MRRFTVRAGITAVTALAALFICGSPAGAVGRTSVVITSQATGEATALPVDTERYRRLEQLLGPATGERKRPPSLKETGGAGGPQVNVSWVVRDVSVWRTDGIYADDPSGTVWIRTVSSGRGSAPRSSETGFWHAAEKPRELRALLGDLGLMGGKTRPVWGRAEAMEGGAMHAVAPGPSGMDGWWTVPGFAAGIGIGCGGTVLLRRWVIRRSLADPVMHHRLLDV
ncbi:hypothetical protein [Streptomyces sp. NPDC047108]|uniref:hypothetical protein n=1 Tax=Streptomyces sp. NPDC047108 TaxID=3155025 RepID=UPI003408C024